MPRLGVQSSPFSSRLFLRRLRASHGRNLVVAKGLLTICLLAELAIIHPFCIAIMSASRVLSALHTVDTVYVLWYRRVGSLASRLFVYSSLDRKETFNRLLFALFPLSQAGIINAGIPIPPS
ncbi:hypothetical protein VTK56DRAFT_7455 [Thermocarpiscus australiensis]